MRTVVGIIIAVGFINRSNGALETQKAIGAVPESGEALVWARILALASASASVLLLPWLWQSASPLL